MATEIRAEDTEASPRQLKALESLVTREVLLGITDLTDVAPWATKDDIVGLVRAGKELGVASVCVNQGRVAAANVANSEIEPDVPISTVVGFPFGDASVYSKVHETRTARSLGAEKIGVVVNTGLLRDSAHNDIGYEALQVLDTMVQTYCPGSKSDTPPRITYIFETGYLTPAEISVGTQIIAEGTADLAQSSGVRVFIQAATGWAHPHGRRGIFSADSHWSIDDIYRIKRAIPDDVRVGIQIGYAHPMKIDAEGKRTLLQCMAIAGCLEEAPAEPTGYRLRKNYHELFRVAVDRSAIGNLYPT